GVGGGDDAPIAAQAVGVLFALAQIGPPRMPVAGLPGGDQFRQAVQHPAGSAEFPVPSLAVRFALAELVIWEPHDLEQQLATLIGVIVGDASWLFVASAVVSPPSVDIVPAALGDQF